jgi:hypothetical protein
LQGDATNKADIAKFMKKLFSNEAKAKLRVLNYRKDNILIHCELSCFPLYDDCGPGNQPKVSHIGVLSKELWNDCDCFVSPTRIPPQLLMNSTSATGTTHEAEDIFELGLPIDRRENSRIYEKISDLPPPAHTEWTTLAEMKLPLALMMRYMLRSRAAIVLVDR